MMFDLADIDTSDTYINKIWFGVSLATGKIKRDNPPKLDILYDTVYDILCE